MFQGRPNKSYFNKDTNIWCGEKYTRYYGENCSIGRIVFEELRKRPKKICQISDTEQTQLTNEDVLLQAIRIAKYYQKIGLQQSDIVGIACRNTTYLMGVVLACFFTGISYHAINPNHDEKTSKHLFQITKPKIIFCDGQDFNKIRTATNDINVETIITLKERVEGILFVKDLLSHVEGETEFIPIELENGMNQTVAILCSSGSTGLPKAVTLSNRTRLYEFIRQTNDEDIIFVSSTMDWLSALILLLGSIIYGAKRIITDQNFSEEYFLMIAEKYHVTTTLLAPSHMAMLAKYPNISADKLNSIKYLLYGGGKCGLQAQIKMHSLLKNGILIFAYGMTEFENIITCNQNFMKKPNSAGYILPGFSLKIINEENENQGPGQIGEICLYHGEKWLGYYNNAKASAELYDKQMWFHSGDLGYMDEDGYLFVVDRKKDILKCHAMQYCPNEIEDVIAQMPDVVDVCVFGVWNDIDGDAAAAAVVIAQGSKLTEKDIVNYVASNIPVKFKHLNAGAIIVSELPKTCNGKLDRKALLDIYLKIKKN